MCIPAESINKLLYKIMTEMHYVLKNRALWV